MAQAIHRLISEPNPKSAPRLPATARSTGFSYPNAANPYPNAIGRRSPRVGELPWGAYEGVPRGRTDPPARRDAFRLGAPLARQHSCHARAALLRVPRRAHPGLSHVGDEHLALRTVQVADHDPVGGHGVAGHPGSGGTLCADPSGSGDEGVAIRASSRGRSPAFSALAGAKPVPLVQQNRIRTSPGARSAGLLRTRFRHSVQYRIVPDTGQIPDILETKLICHPPVGTARIHANQHPAPSRFPREPTTIGRTKADVAPARLSPAGAAAHLGCPRSRRKPQREPSSSGTRHGRSAGCRAGGHPLESAHCPHRPPKNPPTRGTPPVSGTGHSAGSPASPHPGSLRNSADPRSAKALVATAGHRVHRRGRGLPMTSPPQQTPGRGAAGPGRRSSIKFSYSQVTILERSGISRINSSPASALTLALLPSISMDRFRSNGARSHSIHPYHIKLTLLE